MFCNNLHESLTRDICPAPNSMLYFHQAASGNTARGNKMGTSYTEKQREALKKYYPDGNYEVLSKWFPGKTKQQISAAANRIGLKRNHPGYQIDRTGQQYGQLTVLGFDHIDKGKQNTAYWKCRCSCGKECIVASNSLASGNTKSCGCRPRNTKDHTGKRFGRLTAVERLPHYKDGRTYYRCICDCGAEAIVLGGFLASGQTKSCGCLKGKKRKGAPEETKT